MFKKKYLVTLSAFNGEPFDILLELSDSQANTLYNQGISCAPVSVSSGYSVPHKPTNNIYLYFTMFFQDVFRGKFFNKLRYPFYLFILQNYGKTLTKEQKQIVDDFTNNIEESDATLTKNTSLGTVSNELSLKKIILISSSGPGVGKSTLSDRLVDEVLVEATTLSFAETIRKSLQCMFLCMDSYDKDIFDKEYYNKNKNTKIKHLEYFDDFSIRDLLCDYSDTIQMHLGDKCWGTAVANQIKSLNANYIVIDDLRRDTERLVLEEHFGKENIITIFLDKENKEGVETNNVSNTASNYEGKVNPDTYDIKFTYNKNWSNQDQLISLIKEKL